ncbi:MAG: hypothetical protein JXA44_12605 [Methanospirillaceae archaeon]|nr:hypothetical protein [Methanospirillaceae archaeon]
MNRYLIIGIIIILFAISVSGSGLFPADESTLLPPGAGSMYHGVYAPETDSLIESRVSLESIRSYEEAVLKPVAWTLLYNNWADDPVFLPDQVNLIQEAGIVPYIKIAIPVEHKNGEDPLVTWQELVSGVHDESIREWGRDAASVHYPLIVELSLSELFFESFRIEHDKEESINPILYRDVYKRIITLTEEEGAHNIIWVFPMNITDTPGSPDNLAQYYPGDEYIDWMGVSVYGARIPGHLTAPSFSDTFDEKYQEISAINQNKPVIVSEFGSIDDKPDLDQVSWARDALRNLTGYRWPRVIGFGWMNADAGVFEEDGHFDLRVEDNDELRGVFVQYVGLNDFILGTPDIRGEGVRVKESLDYSPDEILGPV